MRACVRVYVYTFDAAGASRLDLGRIFRIKDIACHKAPCIRQTTSGAPLRGHRRNKGERRGRGSGDEEHATVKEYEATTATTAATVVIAAAVERRETRHGGVYGDSDGGGGDMAFAATNS